MSDPSDTVVVIPFVLDETATGGDIYLKYADLRFGITIGHLFGAMEIDARADLLRVMAEKMAANDILDALLAEDGCSTDPKDIERHDLTAPGLKILQCAVAVAEKVDELPDDYEPDWVAGFRHGAERVFTLCCEAGAREAAEEIAHLAGLHASYDGERRMIADRAAQPAFRFGRDVAGVPVVEGARR